MSKLERTPFGFDCRAATTWLRPWGCAKIECLASDEKKGWVYLGVTTPKDCIELYITKTGKVRVYNAKDSTNKKEML